MRCTIGDILHKSRSPSQSRKQTMLRSHCITKLCVEDVTNGSAMRCTQLMQSSDNTWKSNLFLTETHINIKMVTAGPSNANMDLMNAMATCSNPVCLITSRIKTPTLTSFIALKIQGILQTMLK